MKKNYIGCSGFVYPDWKGKFYPSDMPRSGWLSHYATKFNSVELNGTFYRFPVVKNLRGFADAAPDGFRFSVKAHKIITHTLKMNGAAGKVAEFINIVQDGLGDKLGCVLYQLPPAYKYTPENLDHILETVPAGLSSVVEFRHDSWWDDAVFSAFQQKGITFCNSDYPGLPTRIAPSSGLFYMRFHGRPELYKSEYTPDQLKKVVRNIPADTEQRYVYFNNTWFLAAITNAMGIRELIEK
jgi:uncharacterized protein YecE (DUF72 family)